MSDRPNVIVIMTDQQKATASHLYGSTFCETPSMARLAEEGVLFRHAFTPHPLFHRAHTATISGPGGAALDAWAPSAYGNGCPAA